MTMLGVTLSGALLTTTVPAKISTGWFVVSGVHLKFGGHVLKLRKWDIFA